MAWHAEGRFCSIIKKKTLILNTYTHILSNYHNFIVIEFVILLGHKLLYTFFSKVYKWCWYTMVLEVYNMQKYTRVLVNGQSLSAPFAILKSHFIQYECISK